LLALLAPLARILKYMMAAGNAFAMGLSRVLVVAKRKQQPKKGSSFWASGNKHLLHVITFYAFT